MQLRMPKKPVAGSRLVFCTEHDTLIAEGRAEYMKVRVITREHGTGEEPEIIIYCDRKDEEAERLLKLLEALEIRILGSREKVSRQLKPEEIYYFETVDGRVFAYLKEEVWQVQKSLEELSRILEDVRGGGFFRAGKSCIINLRHVEQLTSIMGNRISAKMENGEEVIISRHYARLLRICLRERQYRNGGMNREAGTREDIAKTGGMV